MHSVIVPDAVARVAQRATGPTITYATVPGEGGLRVAALPIAAGAGAPVATVVLWRPIDVIRDYERIAESILAVASLLIIAGALLAGSLIVRRGLRPLVTMAAAASEIEAHDLSRRLDNSEWDVELRDFAATFDRMLDRLQSAFGRQRQFTADASHDLRAPLAVMRAEVDLALARPRGRVADDATFRSIRDEVLELDRLLDTLLLAARADAGPLNATALDLAALAARATDRLAPFALSRSVRIVNTIGASAYIIGDADVLERVVISLLHNGIKFSPPNGTVSLSVLDSTRTVSLIVRDEGPGFSEAALKYAFDRFWKDDSARGRSGTGLGLAIAKSAVERTGGSILIRNVRAGGAEIETVFPLDAPR
jgi:two-component system heavy metal sensor histidine kinase CusS